MKYIDDNIEVAGKLVLVRAGLNVPVDGGRILDDYRIQQAAATLKFLCKRRARVVVIAHIGRDGTQSLERVSEKLNEHVPTTFAVDIDVAREKVKEGEVVVVENLRSDPREVANDAQFAEKLAKGFDLFVQDAFEVCHREHASIVGVAPLLPSYGGLLLKDEMRALQNALNPTHPALFILGGGKVDTKEPLVHKFLSAYDTVLIGGVLQNEILAARGLEIGKSVVENTAVAFDILAAQNTHEVLDVLVTRADGTVQNVRVEEVLPTDVIVDMGRDTITQLTQDLSGYATIVWNGPLGWYERGYDEATILLARAIASTKATKIVGGGDTVAVLEKEGLVEKFTFVSTGGGAMILFLQEGTLPGIEALG